MLKNQSHSQTLIFIIAIVLIVWLTLDWRPGLLMSGNDGISHSIIIRLIAESGGRWFENLYDPSLLGGTDVHPTYGSPILYILLSLLNFSNEMVFNATWVLFQALLAFYVVSIFQIRKWFSILATAVFIGFLPLLGWRLGYGHQSFIWGALLPFVFLFYYTQKVSTSSHLISILALLQIFTSISPQLLLSSIAFLVLFLLLEFKDNKTNIKMAKIPLIVLASCLLVSLPLLLDPLLHLSIGNSSRGIFSKLASDSYYRQDFEAFIRNWTPIFSFPKFTGEHFFLHEFHYPWVYLMPVVIIWKRLDRFTKNILIGSLIGIFFVHANELSGSSGAFKIPMRFLIPFVFLLAAVFISEVLKINHTRLKIFDILIAFIWIYILSSLPAWALFIAFVLISFILILRQSHQILFFIFIGLSVLQFKSMLLPLPDLKKIQKDYSFTQTTSKNVLDREKITFVPELGPSTPRFLNVSAADGYWLPNDRFNQLWSFFESKPYYRGRVYFNSSSKDFLELYNVKQFSVFADGWVLKEQLHPTNFLDKQVIYFDGTSDELFAAIKANKEVIYLKKEDWSAVTSSAQLCKGIEVKDVKQGSLLFNIQIAEQSQPCLIFLPLNHSQFIQVIDSIKNEKLFSSFANYAQFAAYVPMGVRQLELHTNSFVDFKTYVVCFLGLLSLFFVTLKMRKNEIK